MFENWKGIIDSHRTKITHLVSFRFTLQPENVSFTRFASTSTITDGTWNQPKLGDEIERRATRA